MKLKDTQKFVGWRRGRKEIYFQGGEAALTKVKQGMSRVFRGRDEESWRVDGSRGKGWGSGPEAILPEALSAG